MTKRRNPEMTFVVPGEQKRPGTGTMSWDNRARGVKRTTMEGKSGLALTSMRSISTDVDCLRPTRKHWIALADIRRSPKSLGSSVEME